MRKALFITLAIVPALILVGADPGADAAPKKPARGRVKPKKPAKPAKPAKAEPKEPEPADEPAEPAAAGSAAPTIPAGMAAGSGAAGSGSAAPPPVDAKSIKPAPPPVADEPEPTSGPDVDTLRQEYLKLRDELFASKARASTVASQLFSTRIQIKLTYTSGRFYSPGKSVIRLDGANVFDDATGAIAGNDNVRFDGYVAPGRHVLTFRVEATGKDDDSFTSVTETQVVVKAVAGKDLIVNAKARDGGDIAYEWKKSERGSYGLGIDVSVKTAAPAKGSK